MGKYGKKNVVSEDISKVVFGLLGESGVGKTTTMFHIAAKELGDEGYIVLDMGSEWGTQYISDVNAERIETFKKFLEVTNDIIKNKETDYPNLKVVIADTLDEFFSIGEPYLINLYNKEHLGEKKFIPVKTINQVEGGFQHGHDRLIRIIINQIIKLGEIGVGFWYTGHIKRRTTDDIYTGDTYDQLTTNMTLKYFNAIKNKTHVLGIAYTDRTLATQEVGKENPVTKEKKVIKTVSSQSIKVKFRDDSFIADSKSRLKYIVEEVNLNEDEIIKAIKDAIKEEINHPYVPNITNNVQIAPNPKPIGSEYIEQQEDILEEPIEEIADTSVLLDEIRAKFKTAKREIKDKIKDILQGSGCKLSEDIEIDVLNEILDLLN